MSEEIKKEDAAEDAIKEDTAEEVKPEEDAAKTEPEQEEDPKEKKKQNETRRKLIIILIWILLIAGFAFLVLFLASRIGQFNSIADMFDFIKAQF